MKGDFRHSQGPPAMRVAQTKMPSPKSEGILKSRASCPGEVENMCHASDLQPSAKMPSRCPEGTWGILNEVGASGGIWLAAQGIPQANQGRDPDAPRCPGGAGEGIWEVSGAETAMRAVHREIET